MIRVRTGDRNKLDRHAVVLPTVGRTIEVLLEEVEIGRPKVAGGVGNGELLHAPVVRRPAVFREGEYHAGLAGCGPLVALTPVTGHAAAALKFSKGDGQVAGALGGLPRL